MIIVIYIFFSEKARFKMSKEKKQRGKYFSLAVSPLGTFEKNQLFIQITQIQKE